MKPTVKPSGEYTTHSSDVPNIPSKIAPAIDSRRELHKLDSYLQGVKQADNTRQAFSNFYE